MSALLEENVGKENYDGNRLEQELIYYIEKIDISEEQVRLKNHCDYFITILNEEEDIKGKKLSFVLQEIGGKSILPVQKLMIHPFKNALC